MYIRLVCCTFITIITSIAIAYTRQYKSKHPFLILPGFGNAIEDYINPLNKGEENGFSTALTRRGLDVSIVPIQRLEWLKIAEKLVTKSFWDYTCTPKSLFYFYYQKTHDEICKIKERTGQTPILLGHSAGGWLARGMMSNGIWDGNTNTDDSPIVPTKDMVKGLVTLGTPHTPAELQKYDNTRGALPYVHNNYPNAYLSDQDIFYVTISSRAILSNQNGEKKSIEKFAYGSYQQVLGREDNLDFIAGDGVVPLEGSHLDNAFQITFDDVYHSISAPEFNWYGGEPVIDRWLPQVLEINNKIDEKRNSMLSSSSSSSAQGSLKRPLSMANIFSSFKNR